MSAIHRSFRRRSTQQQQLLQSQQRGGGWDSSIVGGGGVLPAEATFIQYGGSAGASATYNPGATFIEYAVGGANANNPTSSALAERLQELLVLELHRDGSRRYLNLTVRGLYRYVLSAITDTHPNHHQKEEEEDDHAADTQ